MPESPKTRLFLLMLPFLLSACGSAADLTVAQGSGAQPRLPAPNPSLLPTVNIAPAVGWTGQETPQPAAGLTVDAYARNLAHPRWLYVLPNGDVLVAESNKPSDESGLRGWIMGLIMSRAGAGVPSADRITLLRDADGDGRAEVRSTFLEGLNAPFGMALLGEDLYVANTDALLRFPYEPGAMAIEAAGEELTALPAGAPNRHWTKNVIASPDGGRLYLSVGSNSDHGEGGLAIEEGRAAVWEVDPSSGASDIYASGLRNPNGMDWEPGSGVLWTVVNERDALGGDLVPDYLTSVARGGFYGWPWSYYGQHVDERVQPPRPERVAEAIVPDYALGPHTASLGLTFYTDGALPERYRGGAFVGQHGSWNRKPPSGYRVVFVPFEDGRPVGKPEEVLTGFLDDEGDARGRPVGVVVDGAGALLVADDVGNTVWRVTAE